MTKKSIFKRTYKFVLAFSLLLTLVAINMNKANAARGSVVEADSKQVVTDMKAHVLTTGDKSDLARHSIYEVNIPTDTKELVVPIKINNSGVLKYTYTDPNEDMSLEFYSDATCTNSIEYSDSSGYAIIPKAGTYYAKFAFPSYDTFETDTLTAKFSCQLYRDNNVTLANNKWKVAGIKDYTKPVYYKVKVNKTGLLKINFEAENTSSFVTLCSSSKKAITDNTTVNGNKGMKVFAVKKGTYYIKVSTNAYWVRVKASTSALKDSSGSSKNKAANLIIGSAKKGYFLLSDKTSKSDWFKFKLTKPTKLSLIVSGNVSAGYIRYELTSTSISGSLTGYLSDIGDVDKTKLVYTTSDWVTHDYLPKGTYILRVYKDSSKTCGNYSVKLAKR